MMVNYVLKKYLDTHDISYECNVSLKQKTWIHRGGIADFYITPTSAKELEQAVSFLYSLEIKFLLVGHTSNIYIYNECNIPVVVTTCKCNRYSLAGNELYCESGVGVIGLSKNMINQGIKGFEYLTGLPGTVGAAIVNNSSCRENSISKLLIKAKVLLNDGSIEELYPSDFHFEFRSSVLKEHKIEGTIISVVLKAEKGDPIELQHLSKYNDQERAHLLEGNAKNLGCTVNRCFINGKMSYLLRLVLLFNSIFFAPFIKNEEDKRTQRKNLICHITGYKSIAPYVSSKNPIIFIWLDEGADTIFPMYLDFMKKIYKTDKVEIEIIDKWQ